MRDENLLSGGRRTALERAAYLLAFVCRRAEGVGLHQIAWVAIEDETGLGIGFGEAVFEHAEYEIVGHQLTGFHHRFVAANP